MNQTTRSSGGWLRRAVAFACPLIIAQGLWATDSEILVTSTLDSDAGSLRAAILAANAETADTVTIKFSLGSVVPNIHLDTALPDITREVTIDATDQVDDSGLPLVRIDGSHLVSADIFAVRAADVRIQGLQIAGGSASGNGVSVFGAANARIMQNIIVSNGGYGIALTDATGAHIEGNRIGLDAKGALAGNGVAILVTTAGTTEATTNVVIGGTTETQRNVISGNGNGINLVNVSHNQVLGNYIGTDINGGRARISALTNRYLSHPEMTLSH
ncbi:MAG: right-handed parallel beta-helix repeat-containing protein [Planctomycetota bacterium]|nr:right-handed parallel beta-helix repeat-containing protein [Planctomycetota bacterium]